MGFDFEKWRQNELASLQPGAARPTTAWREPIGPPVLNETPDLKRFQEPQYSLTNLSRPGQPVQVASKKEAWDYAWNKYGSSAFKMSVDPNGFQSFSLDPELMKIDPYFQKGGSPKTVLPVQSAGGEQVFRVVPSSVPISEIGIQTINPNHLPSLRENLLVGNKARDLFEINKSNGNETGEWDQVQDHYLKSAAVILRDEAFKRNYGDDTAVARYFEKEADNPRVAKIIPDKADLGPLGNPTLTGMYTGAYGSILSSIAANKSTAVGDAMQHAVDIHPYSADVWDRIFHRQRWVPGRNGIRDVIENMYGGEIDHIPEDERPAIWTQAVQQDALKRMGVALENLQDWNKEIDTGIAQWSTAAGKMNSKDAYAAGLGTGISNSLQTLAGSFTATGGPMLASAAVSYLAGPEAGRWASSGLTYKLSHDSEFMDQLNSWFDKHDIDIHAPAEEVSKKMMALAQQDPVKFSRELAGMRALAHTAGALEAGVAYGLDKGLDYALPKVGFGKYSKEGNVFRAAMRVGNRKVFTKLLAPRALHVFEDATKEGIEEYLTEVIVGFGKDAAKNYEGGQEVYDAVRDAVKSMALSYTDDESEASLQASEQRNQAGIVGVYMSLMMKMAVGHGNPDTALIAKTRDKAAEEIHALRKKFPLTGRNRSLAEIKSTLRKLEFSSFEQMADFAEELTLMQGHGDLNDVIAQNPFGGVDLMTPEQRKKFGKGQDPLK